MSGHSTANDLAARLRDLRGRYPSLSVTTELLRLDEILVAFQAVVALNGVPRPAGMRSVLRSRAVSSSRRRRLRRSPRPCCWAASTTMRLTSLRSCPPGRPRRRSWCPAHHQQARRRDAGTCRAVNAGQTDGATVAGEHRARCRRSPGPATTTATRAPAARATGVATCCGPTRHRREFPDHTAPGPPARVPPARPGRLGAHAAG